VRYHREGWSFLADCLLELCGPLGTLDREGVTAEGCALLVGGRAVGAFVVGDGLRDVLRAFAPHVRTDPGRRRRNLHLTIYMTRHILRVI